MSDRRETGLDVRRRARGGARLDRAEAAGTGRQARVEIWRAKAGADRPSARRGACRFDIRLQGDAEPVFLEL